MVTAPKKLDEEGKPIPPEKPVPKDVADITAFLATSKLAEWAPKFHSWQHLIEVKSASMRHDLGIPCVARKEILRQVERWKQGGTKPGWRKNPTPYYVSKTITKY